MRRAPALSFLLVTVFVDILGLGLAVPIAPRLITELGGRSGSGPLSYGLLVASYGVLQFVCSPLLGSLSDRYGRRPVLLTSLAFLGLNYLAHGLTPVLWLLFVSHALAGATGGTYTVVNAYIADVTPAEGRARAYGLIGAAFSLGFVAGPAVGGLLGDISLRLPFYLAAALAAANVCYGALVLPESHPADPSRPVRWNLANPVGALVAIVRRADIGKLAWHRLCSDIARQVDQVVWVLYATERFGWGTGMIGLALAGSAVVRAGVQALLAERCIRRLGERRTVVMGSALAAASFAGYTFAPHGWLLYPLLALQALAGIAAVAAQSWISQAIGRHEHGSVQGVLTSIGSLTEASVPIAATAIFAWSLTAHTPGLVYLFGAAFLLVAVLLAGTAPRVTLAPRSNLCSNS